jgi:hypothetical protein
MCDFQLNWTIRNLRAKLLSIETCWDFFYFKMTEQGREGTVSTRAAWLITQKTNKKENGGKKKKRN